MILREFRIYFSTELSSIYPKTEIDTFFFLLIEEYLDLNRIDTVLNPDFKIGEEKLSLLKSALVRLKQEIPIQYIIGKTEFFGYPFLVDGNTLIPRPETEELVEWIIKEISNLKSLGATKLSILDIGTGTGCIPISLAKNILNATISAIDVSAATLKIAKQNAVLNSVDINFIETDILKIASLNKLTQSQNILFDAEI